MDSNPRTSSAAELFVFESEAIPAPPGTLAPPRRPNRPRDVQSLPLPGNSAAWVFEAAKKLESLGQLRPGWDSYGGLPLNLKSRALIVNVLGWLSSDELPTPAVVLGSEGNVHLEWRTNGRELELEFQQDEKILFVKVHPDGLVEEGEIKGNVPDAVRGLTCWLMHGEPPMAS